MIHLRLDTYIQYLVHIRISDTIHLIWKNTCGENQNDYDQIGSGHMLSDFDMTNRGGCTRSVTKQTAKPSKG